MLLRRITEHVKAQNWTAVTLDFVIVVVGVFIGIQVSNWNEARGQAHKEEVVLRQLRTSLLADLAGIDGELDRYRRIDSRVSSILDHLRTKRPYDPSMDADFGAMYGFNYLALDRAAYESLKSSGIELISNDRLRAQIARVYEKRYQLIERSMTGERDVVLEILRPYFLDHFRDMRFTVSATPIEYQTLVEDIRFANLADYRLQTVRNNQLPNFEAARADIVALIAAIDAEVGGGNDQIK